MSQKAMLFERWTKAEKPDSAKPKPKNEEFQLALFALLTDQASAMVKAVESSSIPSEVMQRVIEEIRKPEWITRIADAAKPFLEEAVEVGGNAGIRKLPGAMGFDVTNPEVQRFIDRYRVRLASAINEHTEVAARQLLGDGLEKGESIPELAKRARQWTEAAQESGEAPPSAGNPAMRAERIARTESARAQVEGEIEAWKQSGVVTGKKWLLASDACEFCKAMAAQFETKVMPLAQPFIHQGGSIQAKDGSMMRLDYSDVNGPPLHPQCRCDLVPVLEDE